MSGFVYFISSEPDRFVKIGWAKHCPRRRLRELQTGCPEPLRLLAWFPGSREDERRLHATFAELHFRGEWFYNRQKLSDLIQYLNEDVGEAKEMAPRQLFEDAAWDVIISGYDYPDRADIERYNESGNGSLWLFLHPEEELA